MPAITFRPSGEHDWTSRAACSAEGAPDMFPHDQDVRGQREAKAVCDACPVRTDCLDAAFKRGETHGIWGGLDRDERVNLIRARRRK